MTVQTIPILPTSDFDATSTFYKTLGFEDRGRWPSEYPILEHPIGIELHFWFNAALQPMNNDVGCYVRLGDEATAHALLEDWHKIGLPDAGSMGVPRLNERDEDGEFALIDVNGNLLRLNA